MVFEKRVFSELEQFVEGKAIHVPLFSDARMRAVMLCLAPGTGVPPHAHPGFQAVLQPLRGKGLLTGQDGNEITLEPGMILFLDGEHGFDPHNPFGEPFAMLVEMVKK